MGGWSVAFLTRVQELLELLQHLLHVHLQELPQSDPEEHLLPQDATQSLVGTHKSRAPQMHCGNQRASKGRAKASRHDCINISYVRYHAVDVYLHLW